MRLELVKALPGLRRRVDGPGQGQIARRPVPLFTRPPGRPRRRRPGACCDLPTKNRPTVRTVLRSAHGRPFVAPDHWRRRRDHPNRWTAGQAVVTHETVHVAADELRVHPDLVVVSEPCRPFCSTSLVRACRRGTGAGMTLRRPKWLNRGNDGVAEHDREVAPAEGPGRSKGIGSADDRRRIRTLVAICLIRTVL